MHPSLNFIRLAVPCALLLLTLGACGERRALERATASPERPAEEQARDIYRHPVETLQFLGIERDMTVVELWPGSGWYSRILAPYLQKKGTLYAAHFPPDPTPEYRRRFRQKYEEAIRDNPAFSAVKITSLGRGNYDIAPEESADMVLTFRNLNNWISEGYISEVFDAAWHSLKPGGIFGVVEHRGFPGMSVEDMASSGYVPEEYAIQLIESAGFRLVGRSEINANPRDEKNYPAGVWTLPPVMRLGDQDREKYQAIGESDRFTLKFVKIK